MIGLTTWEAQLCWVCSPNLSLCVVPTREWSYTTFMYPISKLKIKYSGPFSLSLFCCKQVVRYVVHYNYGWISYKSFVNKLITSFLRKFRMLYRDSCTSKSYKVVIIRYNVRLSLSKLYFDLTHVMMNLSVLLFWYISSRMGIFEYLISQ